jgi:hypothetical protein
MWFRAVFEISTRRTGISAMDLMRIMGFGSYKTAWTWLHKLRAALVRPERSASVRTLPTQLTRRFLHGHFRKGLVSSACSCWGPRDLGASYGLHLQDSEAGSHGFKESA